MVPTKLRRDYPQTQVRDPCQKYCYYLSKLCTLGRRDVNFVYFVMWFVHIVVCYKGHTHNGVDS